jgi:hypothetical protein
MKLPLSSSAGCCIKSLYDDGGRDAEFLEIYSTVTDIFAEYTPVYFIVTSKALNIIESKRDSAYHCCLGAPMA